MYLYCRQNLRKSRFSLTFSVVSNLIKIYKNLDFIKFFRKISSFIIILEYLDISKNNSKISISIKIYKNLDFRQNRQFWCKSRFWKISTTIEIFPKLWP